MTVKRNPAAFIRLLIIVSIAPVGEESLAAAEEKLTSAKSERLQAAKPNVVIVIADQWRASAFGFSGDPNVKTPHLDRLARESFRCINAVAGLPVCCPTRASLLTAHRPLTTGLFMNDVPLAPDAVTLAKVFREAGYDTGYIGKWHLNGDGRSNFIPRERRQGFDYWKALECTHDYNHSYLQRKLAEAHYQFLSADEYLRERGSQVKEDGTVPYEP